MRFIDGVCVCVCAHTFFFFFKIYTFIHYYSTNNAGNVFSKLGSNTISSATLKGPDEAGSPLKRARNTFDQDLHTLDQRNGNTNLFQIVKKISIQGW